MIRMRRRNNAATKSNNKDERDTLKDVPVQWRRMVAYLRPYIPRLILALVATLVSAILSLVFPQVVQRVLDSVLEQADYGLLNTITIILLIVFMIRSIASLIETYNLNYIGERIVVDLRLDLYKHLQSLSIGFYTNQRVGELVSRISSDVTVMRSVLTSNINTLLQQTFIMFGSIILMFALNWRLTLFIIALIPIVVLLGFVFGYYMRRISAEVQDEIAGSTVVAEEVFQNIREVKSFVREPYEIKRYSNAIDRAFAAAVRLLRIRAVFGPTVGFLAFGGLSMVLWFGGREVIAERLSAGELIAFLIYGLTVAGSFTALIGLYTSFQEALGATRRVFQLMDTPLDIANKPDAIAIDRAEGHIVFDDVQFSYEDDHAVLSNINLDIAPGEILALVGPSGAGKSTMFNLIPRFYDPSNGKIKVDNHDLRDLTHESLRTQIAIVPQETLLFGGTIRENIQYGRLDASEEEIIDAANAANAHTFITELPKGYETLVGERGIRLSGGQRQRIAIARAILKDPRILLLDEATSSLDNESEHLVQDALSRLMRGRTTVIIAHRLSTIAIADRIAVLNKGEIVELGTHDQLMTLNGLYAKLYEMQFRNGEFEIVETGTHRTVRTK